MMNSHSVGSPVGHAGDAFGGRLESGLSIDEDIAGQRLRLIWQGAPPWTSARRFAGAGLLAGICVWLYVLYSLSLPLWTKPEETGDFVMVGVVGVFGAYALYTLAAVAGKGLVYWREFLWDVAEGNFVAKQRGWLLWGHKTESVPLNEIESLWLDLGPEGQGQLAAGLRQYYTDDSEFGFSTTIGLKPLRLARRTEAIEFFFTLARLLRAKGYACTINTFQEQKLVVWKELPRAERDEDEEIEEEFDDEELEEEGEELSALNDYAPPDPNYADPARMLAIPVRGELPSELLAPPPPTSTRPAERNHPPFDLAAFRERIATWKIETWDPGTTVQITKPAEPFGLVIAVGVVGLVVGGLAGWFPLWGAAQLFTSLADSDRYLFAGLVAVAGGLLLAFAIWNHSRAQELLFDWRRGLFTWRNGSEVRDWPLASILGVSLTVARRRTQASSSQSSEPSYSHHVKLLVGDTTVVVVRDEVEQAQVGESRRILAPFAFELADALGVECATELTADVTPPLRETFRLTLGQSLTLASLLLIMAGWLGTLGVVEARSQLAARQVRGLGVEIHRMGSFKRDDRLIGTRYWSIQAKDCSAFQVNAPQLRALVDQLGNVGLDLDPSNCGDADLAHFRGSPAVRIVRISDTPVTDAGIVALAECPNLHYLDATGCRIGDESAIALGKLRKLQFLYISATQITPDGLQALAQIPSLQVIHVGGTKTNSAGLKNMLREMSKRAEQSAAER